jgi:CspA family cold shock protein
VTELVRRTGHRGRVTEFDEAAGLGCVVSNDGTGFAFHCIEIADGTRVVAVGAEVSFDVLAKLGRWEAANLRP